jgi:hypothetical protein
VDSSPAFYLGDSRNKSLPIDQLSWLRSLWFYSVLPGKCLDSTSNEDSSSFPIYYSYHPIIIFNMVWTTESTVNPFNATDIWCQHAVTALLGNVCDHSKTATNKMITQHRRNTYIKNHACKGSSTPSINKINRTWILVNWFHDRHFTNIQLPKKHFFVHYLWEEPKKIKWLILMFMQIISLHCKNICIIMLLCWDISGFSYTKKKQASNLIT